MATFSQWEDLRRRPRGSEPWLAGAAGPRHSGAPDVRGDVRRSLDRDPGATDSTPTAG